MLPVLCRAMLPTHILSQSEARCGKKGEEKQESDHAPSSRGVSPPLLQVCPLAHMIAIMRELISILFSDARGVDLTPGETLFRSGEDVADVFMVRSGRVLLQRHTTQGAHMVLQNAGPGAVVAEASAYSERYHCDAVAAGETVVAALPKPLFLTALADDPALAASWSAMLARSVQAARFRSEIRSLPRVADRLNAWLEEGNRLPEKGHWQDVAGELGVTREALYRELSRRRT